MTKYLGLDYGEAKIGVAMSEGELASPYGVFRYGQNKQKLLLRNRAIALFCQRNKIEKIVIGLSENKIGEKTKKFGEELAKITGLPVVYQDETLTSQTAVKKMVEFGKSKMRRRLDQHAVAAALILQDWLENLRI